MLVSFTQECASVLCRDFAPKMDPNLIYRLSDLVNCFELLCGIGGYDVLSMCVPPGLFDRGLLQPALSDMGTLVVAGVRFDVSGAVLLRRGDSVCAGSHLMMSYDTGDGDWFPVATASRSRTSGSRCCGWLQFVTQGGGACDSSNQCARAHRRTQPERWGGACQDCVHSAGISGSPAGDWATASVNSRLLLYCVVFPIVL